MTVAIKCDSLAAGLQLAFLITIKYKPYLGLYLYIYRWRYRLAASPPLELLISIFLKKSDKRLLRF